MMLTFAQLATILDHAAQDRAEVCGMLIGRRVPQVVVDRIVAARNVHPSPDQHFLVDAATLLHADATARAAGREIVGFYHSHPHGSALPSLLDRQAAWVDQIHLIVADWPRGMQYVCAWRIAANRTLRPELIHVGAEVENS